MRLLSDLLGDRELDLTTANGEPIPYDGWAELTFYLPGNDDPILAIRVPFLVSQVSLARPIVGFNVLRKKRAHSTLEEKLVLSKFSEAL